MCLQVAHLGVAVESHSTATLGMRVGAVNGTWEQGKVIVFDDSYEHEIWHRGTERRVALLLHLQHPALAVRPTLPPPGPPVAATTSTLPPESADSAEEQAGGVETVAAALRRAKLPSAVVLPYAEQLFAEGFETLSDLKLATMEDLSAIVSRGNSGTGSTERGARPSRRWPPAPHHSLPCVALCCCIQSHDCLFVFSHP